MRKDNSFDDIIREKLSRVTPVYQPGDWELLKERLDESRPSQQEDIEFFDRMVRNKAPKRNEAGLSYNWTSLIARLDFIYMRERQILSTKILELAALLLLLIVIDRDFALSPGPMVSNPSPHTETTLSAPQKHALPDVTPYASTGASRTQVDVSFTGIDMAGSESAVEAFVVSNHVPGENLNQLPALSVPELASQVGDEDWRPALTPVRSFETVSSLKNRVKALQESTSATPGKILRLRPRPHFSLSMFGSTDFNRIHTPAYTSGAISDANRASIYVAAYDRYALGYSGGMSIAFGKKQWETEAGLIYTAKQYQARPVVYVTGSVQEGFFGEGLKDIEMNIVAVPVHWRLDLFKRNGWRVYAGAGASLQVVLESNYSVADQDAFRSRNFNPSPSFPDSPGFLKSTGLSNKNLDGGWLQGGSFANNSFITANASLGLERRFLGGWSFFAQPTYHHSVFYFSNGLGPDYERLHTFSLFSGVRVRL